LSNYNSNNNADNKISNGISMKFRPNRKTPSSVLRFFKCSLKLNFSNFAESLKHFDEIMAQTIGAPKIPAVNWQDVGENTLWQCNL
jgi:hypothetical protein